LKTYFPTINLLRGIAALMVCFYHFILHTDSNGKLFQQGGTIEKIGEHGINGVYVFFVISGFVIPFALLKSDFKISNIHRFLLKRLIRIEIPYIASILLIISISLFYALKNDTEFLFSIKQFALHLFYLIPFSSEEWYNVIYWTLAIEFQFYIIIALFFSSLNNSNSKIVLTGILLFGASNFLGIDNRLIFNYTLLFLPGILLFLFKTNKISGKLVSILLIINTLSLIQIHGLEIAISCALTILAIQFLDINKKWTNKLGEISYSLYLTHGVIGGTFLYLTARFFQHQNERILLLIPACFFSLLFAFLFWKLIEKPSKDKASRIK
jgi:peptidoglycan/LPS O-acetylase OafA/YrhL